MPSRQHVTQTSRLLSQQSHQLSLLNRIARVLLSLMLIHAVIGELTGFEGPAAAIAAKGLTLAPMLLVVAIVLWPWGLPPGHQWLEVMAWGRAAARVPSAHNPAIARGYC